MTATRRVVPSQPLRAPQGAGRSRGPHRRAARARTALAVAMGSLAGVVLGMCCGLRTAAVDVVPVDAGSRPAPGDGPAPGSTRQPQPSVAAVLAPAVGARPVAARHGEDLQP